MGSFFGWTLESSLLVVMILGIRRAFMGKVRYAGIYALWLVILLRLLVPVNVISTPFSIGDMVSQKVSSWNLDERAGQDGGSRSFSGGDKLPRPGISSLIDVWKHPSEHGGDIGRQMGGDAFFSEIGWHGGLGKNFAQGMGSGFWGASPLVPPVQPASYEASEEEQDALGEKESGQNICCVRNKKSVLIRFLPSGHLYS